MPTSHACTSRQTGADEAGSEIAKIVNKLVDTPPASGALAAGPSNVEEARSWINAWKARVEESSTPAAEAPEAPAATADVKEDVPVNA